MSSVDMKHKCVCVCVCWWCVDLPEPLYKTVYVDSATLGVRLTDSVAEPIHQFYVQYRPTGESRSECRLICHVAGDIINNDTRKTTLRIPVYYGRPM